MNPTVHRTASKPYRTARKPQNGWARMYGTLASIEMRGRTYSLSGAVVRAYGAVRLAYGLGLPYKLPGLAEIDVVRLIVRNCASHAHLLNLNDSRGNRKSNLCADKLAIYVRRSDGIMNEAACDER
jgi:hypothetical protein